MARDMNGREIKVGDVFCRPSDCEGLQFIGVVEEVADDCITGATMQHSDYSCGFQTKSYYEPADIRVLCSIEDTREVKEATAEAEVARG